MEKVIIQLWEISNSDNTILSDGCSIHINDIHRTEFVKITSSREERPVGSPSDVLINKNIFEILKKDFTIRLSEAEMNNLIGLKDLKPI